MLDFKEGVITLSAKISIGAYTGRTLAIEIKKQMEAVGSNTYDVTYDRETRKFTISSTASFNILIQSGPFASQSVYSVLGFSSTTDLIGQSTYISDIASGKIYRTQHWIQSHKPTSQNRKSIDPVVNKSASGVIEVVKYGNERFMNGEFLFITNIIQGDQSIIRTNENGVQDFLDLMEWLTEKYVVEFMVDESKIQEFQTFILESTEQDSRGLDFELIELYDKSLPEYFRSGVLKFRLME